MLEACQVPLEDRAVTVPDAWCVAAAGHRLGRVRPMDCVCQLVQQRVSHRALVIVDANDDPEGQLSVVDVAAGRTRRRADGQPWQHRRWHLLARPDLGEQRSQPGRWRGALA